MPLRFTSRPASDRVKATLTVGSARRATDCLVNAACLILLHTMRTKQDVEREAAREVAMELLRLGNWFGRLVEDER